MKKVLVCMVLTVFGQMALAAQFNLSCSVATAKGQLAEVSKNIEINDLGSDPKKIVMYEGKNPRFELVVLIEKVEGSDELITADFLITRGVDKYYASLFNLVNVIKEPRMFHFTTGDVQPGNGSRIGARCLVGFK